MLTLEDIQTFKREAFPHVVSVDPSHRSTANNWLAKNGIRKDKDYRIDDNYPVYVYRFRNNTHAANFILWLPSSPKALSHKEARDHAHQQVERWVRTIRKIVRVQHSASSQLDVAVERWYSKPN